MKLELITLGVVLAFFAAFAYVSSTGNHEWSGADSQAENVITKLTGGAYQPWFLSIYTPPSGEIESLIFRFAGSYRQYHHRLFPWLLPSLS